MVMRVDPRAWKRAALVWFVALVMFAIPRPGTAVSIKTLFHQPLFLMIAPIVLAGLSLLVPVKDTEQESEFYRQRRSKQDAWTGILCCILLALFVIAGLLLANSSVTPENADFNHRFTNVCGVALALLVGGVIYFARDLRRR